MEFVILYVILMMIVLPDIIAHLMGLVKNKVALDLVKANKVKLPIVKCVIMILIVK